MDLGFTAVITITKMGPILSLTGYCKDNQWWGRG
jgi:hypothetical protein